MCLVKHADKYFFNKNRKIIKRNIGFSEHEIVYLIVRRCPGMLKYIYINKGRAR